MFNNIEEALNFVINRPRGEIAFDDFKKACNKLNNPQNGFRMIHVTGTNGKGSTITFLRDLLMAHGFSVGTLQSPHFITHLDRIRFNKNNIDKDYFLKWVNDYYDFIIQNNIGMFEIDYLVALDYFRYKKADYVIIEVGIGGRLDSTNVVDDTSLSIITSIGLDHTELLGDTKELICKEKCGIIKDNSHILVSNIDSNLKDIVKEYALKHNSVYHELDNIDIKSDNEFIYKGNKYILNNQPLYQIYNSSLAIEALNILSNIYKFNIDKSKIDKALSEFVWNGRYEVISNKPKIILDGGHNPEGIEKLLESFDKEKGKKLIVFSALKRKNFKEMYSLLKNHSDKLVLTTFNYPGSIDENDVDDDTLYVRKYIEYINKNKNLYDVILICGSLYFISDAYININSLR